MTRSLTWLGVFIYVAVPVYAQAPLALTLDEAVSRGLAASHRLAEAMARAQAATAAAAEQRAAALPQIAALAGYTRTNHVNEFGVPISTNQLRVIYPDVPNNYRTRVDLQWPIYTAGRIDALERAAQAEADAAAGDLGAARSDLRLEIVRAYWALVTAIEALRVVDESVARVGAHVADVRNQFDAGLVPPNDILSAQTQESRERMLAVQARTRRDVAEAELARLVDAAPGSVIRPTAVLAPPPATTRTIESLIEEARGQRADRTALVSRVAASEERQRAAAGGMKPVVSLGGGFDYARPNPRMFPREDAWQRSWDASVNVTWPWFDGGRTRAALDQSAASTRAVRERLAELDSRLDLEIRQRLSEISSSEAVIAAAVDGVASAVEARRVVGERFAAGVATSTDVVDAQLAVLQAELDRTQAIAAAQLAAARLDRAIGR